MYHPKEHIANASRAVATFAGSSGVALPAPVFAAPPYRPAAPPVQRKIKWGTSKLLGGTIESKDALVKALHNKFPRFDIEAITNDVNDIDGQEVAWSLADIYRVFADAHKQLPAPLVEREQNSDILLPGKPNDRKNYAFTTRTRLRAKIVSGDQQTSIPEFTQDDEGHAEDYLRAYLGNLISEEDGEILARNGALFITLNNSPCAKRCAPRLARFKKKYWKGRMVIYFANPHGSEEEYIEARQRMREAGIEVHSFEPRHYIDESLWSQDTERFLSIKDRRKRYRKSWNKAHPSDISDDSDVESSSSKEKKEERKKKKRTPEVRRRKRKEREGKIRLKSPPKKKRSPVNLDDVAETGNSSDISREEEEVSPRDLHKSVLSEARRIGIDAHYRIGYADGTDRNCSILSIFAAAGAPLGKEDGIAFRNRLTREQGIPAEGDLDVEDRGIAQHILAGVTRQTGQGYSLNTVQEDVDGGILVTEIARTGDGANSIYIFFAGTHFSPVWPL